MTTDPPELSVEKPSPKTIEATVELYDTVTFIFGWLSALLALGCLVWAIVWRWKFHVPHAPAKSIHQWIVGGWTLIPPFWFWVHWYKCPYHPRSPEWERMTHGHEVS